MARVFSIQTVLRMVPNRLVRQFLERLGHTSLKIPWKELREREFQPILDVIDSFTPTQFNEVESGLRTVFDLACAPGNAAIIEAGELAGDASLRADMPENASFYEQAMWAWLNRSELVTTATQLHQIDTFPWWRRRDDLPKRKPDCSRKARDRLARSISSLLTEQGRGRVCTVETMTRGDLVYFFAYPDDHVQSLTAHDDEGHLEPRTVRPTFLIVFAFCPAEGSLELFAKLSPQLKLQMEMAFAEAILDTEIDEWRPRASYELNALKRSTFTLATDPVDNVTVEIRKMQLSLRNSKRQIVLKADPNFTGDIFRMLDEALNKERVPMSAVNITMVTFCFEFGARPGRRAGSATFDVVYPNQSGLKNQPTYRTEMVEKYLRRWGIYAARTAEPGTAEA